MVVVGHNIMCAGLRAVSKRLAAEAETRPEQDEVEEAQCEQDKANLTPETPSEPSSDELLDSPPHEVGTKLAYNICTIWLSHAFRHRFRISCHF